MHEVSIMQDMLQLAEENLRKSGCTEIRRIKLRVGLLSGVVPEALSFAFDVLKSGTSAANAILEIESSPSLFSCGECGRESWYETMRFECPECHGILILQQGGTDLELTQMEVSSTD